MSEQIVLSLDRVIALIKRGLLVALLLAAATAALVYAYTRRLPPSYSAQAVVTISPTGFDSSKYGLPSVVVPALHVTAYRIAALSDDLLGAALAEQDVTVTPSAVQRLRERTAISTDTQALLVYVTVTAGTAAGAAQTANAVTGELVAWDAARSAAALKELITVLQQRAASTATELQRMDAQDQAASARLVALQTVAAQTQEDLSAAEKLAQDAPGSVTLLRSAAPPLTTVAPTPLFNAALAALLIVALVYGYLFLRETLDPRIYSAEDALRATRLPLLAIFGTAKREQSYSVEAGGQLRDGLAVTAGGAYPAAIHVSSVGANEGAVAVAAALAEALTFSGYRTLLVDADMADPRLQNLYRSSGRHATNLSDYLKHPEQQYQANPVPIGQTQPLYVLYETTPLSHGPTALTRAFAGQLARWREEFDVVIVRSAPWSTSQDAALVAPLVSGTVLVTKAHRLRKRLVVGELAALRRVGGHVYGLVITQAKRDDPAAMARSATYDLPDAPVTQDARTSGAPT